MHGVWWLIMFYYSNCELDTLENEKFSDNVKVLPQKLTSFTLISAAIFLGP